MATPNPYTHLFSPLQLPHVQLKNRVTMGSMHTGLESGGRPEFKRLGIYFAERARHDVAMIITGGISPSREGSLLKPGKDCLLYESQIDLHRLLTEAVHSVSEDCKICLQIMHAGSLARHRELVAPSAVKSRINPLTPRALTGEEVERVIEDHVRCATLAKAAGYDGVEVIGSAGYLISSFLLANTNRRTDRWGGDYQARCRFPIAIIRRIREALGEDFLVIYRLAVMELIDKGSAWDEVVFLAKAIEDAGASMISTHFSWHEASIPTISTRVPRAAFTRVSGKIRAELRIPVITSNRINTPDVAERVLSAGHADMVSLGRPLLADPAFLSKARRHCEDDINTCIACNQACLDNAFRNEIISCLVNPMVCRESELLPRPVGKVKKIAVVGAGPAGLSFAITAAERGHKVTLFDQAPDIGGHFNLARKIPGKEEFNETIRYYRRQLRHQGVIVCLGHPVTAAELLQEAWSDIVIATGVRARIPEIPGIDYSNVLSYQQAIENPGQVGERVAIIGAGGIGFDVAELLSHSGSSSSLKPWLFAEEWGIDFENHPRGGVEGVAPVVHKSSRRLYLLQRSRRAFGATLGPTTGWVHKLILRRRGVEMLNGVEYRSITERGLDLLINDEPRFLEVDSIVICAGQDSNNHLYNELTASGVRTYKIGGALSASEVDARRAIDEGTQLGLQI